MSFPAVLAGFGAQCHETPASPIKCPSGSVKCATTRSVRGACWGPIWRVPPRLSAFASASTSGTPPVEADVSRIARPSADAARYADSVARRAGGHESVVARLRPATTDAHVEWSNTGDRRVRATDAQDRGRVLNMTHPGRRGVLATPAEPLGVVLPCWRRATNIIRWREVRRSISWPTVDWKHPHVPQTDVRASKPSEGGIWAGGSASGDEGHHDVGGVAVEVLTAPVIHRGGARISMPGSHLHLSERHSCIESSHDERRSQHVRMHQPEPCPFADGADPPVGRAPIEALAVMANQNRALSSFPDGEVDRTGGAGNERDEGRFVALANDPQHPVAPLEGHFLNVGLAGLADPEAVQPQQRRQSGMGVVEALGGEEEPPSSPRSSPRRSDGWTLGRRTYWAGLAGMRPSM